VTIPYGQQVVGAQLPNNAWKYRFCARFWPMLARVTNGQKLRMDLLNNVRMIRAGADGYLIFDPILARAAWSFIAFQIYRDLRLR
jgi:hypothetical protein